MSEAIKVAVRVRPFNARERERGARCIVRMNGDDDHPHPDSRSRARSFDHCTGRTTASRPTRRATCGPPATPPRTRRRSASSPTSHRLLDNGGRLQRLLVRVRADGLGQVVLVVGYGENRGIVPLRARRSSAEGGAGERRAAGARHRLDARDTTRSCATSSRRARRRPSCCARRRAPSSRARSGCGAIVLRDRRADGPRHPHRTVASTSMNATSSRAHTVVTITVAQLRARGDGGERPRWRATSTRRPRRSERALRRVRRARAQKARDPQRGTNARRQLNGRAPQRRGPPATKSEAAKSVPGGRGERIQTSSSYV